MNYVEDDLCVYSNIERETRRLKRNHLLVALFSFFSPISFRRQKRVQNPNKKITVPKTKQKISKQRKKKNKTMYNKTCME